MSASETQTAANRFRFLVEAVTWRYRAQGFAVRRIVRKQLLSDPIYREWLAAGVLPSEGLVLQLGCGRGVFLALMACSHTLGMGAGQKKGGRLQLMGVEQNADKAESARLALAERADILLSELPQATLPSCRMVVLLDVLRYLEAEAQDQLLERIAAALETDGYVMLREWDANGFWRRQLVRLLAMLEALQEGKRKRDIYPRSKEDWKKGLESLGLHVESRVTGSGIGLSKILLTARKSPCAESL